MSADSIRNGWLAVIGTIVLIAALRFGYPVAMPIVVALFIIAGAWPIKAWLDDRMPTALSYIGAIVVLLVILAGFLGVIYYSLAQVVQSFYNQQDDFRELYNTYANWAKSNGFPVLGGNGGFDRLLGIARSFLADVYTVLSYLGLISVIVILGFPQVPVLANKIRQHMEATISHDISGTSRAVADSFRSYIKMTVITSLITGVASTLWALGLGLDLAVTWGVLNFLLNFIPAIGSILGILPPTLYAFIQYDSLIMPLVVFVGFAVLQLTIGNFVYPMLQARGVSMPPVMIILALLFWGWLWGIAGALMAVPLTVAVAIVFGYFDSTKKFAAIVMEGDVSDSDRSQR